LLSSSLELVGAIPSIMEGTEENETLFMIDIYYYYGGRFAGSISLKKASPSLDYSVMALSR